MTLPNTMQIRPLCHSNSPMLARIDRSSDITLICAACGEVCLKVHTSKAIFERVGLEIPEPGDGG